MQCAPTERLQILLCPRVDEGIDLYRVHAASINKPGSAGNPVLYYIIYSGCRKTPQKTDATEQRGVCAGGKKPTARSINRILKLFESFKIRTAWRKDFFDTLYIIARGGGG